MKKSFLVLFIATLFAGSSFASFYVDQSENDMSGSDAKLEVVSESLDISAESMANPAATTSSKSSEGKNGTVAIILAIVSVIFLPFGLHNWYLGRTKQALWQLLLVFPLGILILPAIASWIWQVVDLIRLLISGGTL